MLQKFELNELTENKVISIKLENGQHVRHRHENMINPGTTADLTAASIFVSYLESNF